MQYSLLMMAVVAALAMMVAVMMTVMMAMAVMMAVVVMMVVVCCSIIMYTLSLSVFSFTHIELLFSGWAASLFRLGPHTVLCLVFWDQTRALYLKWHSKQTDSYGESAGS